MTRKDDKRMADRLFEDALQFLLSDGWASHDIDELIADRLYATWLKDTQAMWESSAYRDRAPLQQALEQTFTEHYGEDGGAARLVVFALLLECRSRREGQVRRGRHEA
jgi:hypothetical protein